MTASYPYDIAAHQSRVEDLPKLLLTAIREVMEDTSYGNDESAKFEALSPKKEGIALRLWVDHKDKSLRCEEDEFRFHLAYVNVDIKDPSYTPEDFSCFINDSSQSFFVSNDFDELAKELSDCLPVFDKKYKALSGLKSTAKGTP